MLCPASNPTDVLKPKLMIEKHELDSTFGYPFELWTAAKEQARDKLIKLAKAEQLIGYAELTSAIQSIRFDPHGDIFRRFLGQLSTEEDAAGRGMITAIVVHKTDGLPGIGFYRLAKSLGRNISDPELCWANEVKRVFSFWRGGTGQL